MQYDFLVLLPPVVVVILAAITKNVRVSVGVAIVIAGLIVSDFSIPGAAHIIANRFWWDVAEANTLTSWNVFQAAAQNVPICIFLLLLGIIIELIQQSGGAYAYGTFIIDKLKSAKNAQRASLVLSLVFAMDDYFNSLTVGAVMRPVTDQFRIARVKLALLVNTLASPLAVLFPFSSWAGQIITSLKQAGVGPIGAGHVLVTYDPFSLYLASIPFLLYPLVALFAIWVMVGCGWSFGLLAKHETIATKTGNLFAGRVSVMRHSRKGINNQFQASIVDFLLPIVLLVASVIGFYLHGSTIFISLLKGGVITVVVSALFLCIRRRIALRDIPLIVKHGIFLMSSSVMVVLVIWTLSALLRYDLHTGDYLAGLVGGHVSVVFFPVLLFILAMIMSATMGSAWGTIGILMPIAVPMVLSLYNVVTPIGAEQILLLLPVIGAVVSGAVSGNHLSPIADVMFMSATSAGCYHLDLVRVMVSFAVPVVISTACAFGVMGVLFYAGHGTWVTVTAAFIFGGSINIAIMGVLHRMSHRGDK